MSSDSVSAPAAPLLPAAELDTLVHDIARLYRQSTLDFALALGRLVVDRIYRVTSETGASAPRRTGPSAQWPPV
jgi:hypothetical protein